MMLEQTISLNQGNEPTDSFKTLYYVSTRLCVAMFVSVKVFLCCKKLGLKMHLSLHYLNLIQMGLISDASSGPASHRVDQ